MAVQQVETKFVAWFMSGDVNHRIVAFEWWPLPDAVDQREMTAGELVYKKRDEPGDVWSPPKTVAANVPLIVARRVALGQGFEYEETTRLDETIDVVRLDAESSS